LTGQEHPKTSIVYEFPMDEGDPYYPVPRPENKEIHRKYKALADGTLGVHFVGRLATYQYYNMDQVTAQALTLFNKISTEVQVPVAEFSGKKMLYPSYTNGKLTVQVKDGNQNGKKVA
ncbi:MAG TPA: UDP-galactopyranose mutase, partial [Blattabacteriaceae bacterium]|nr:UDP-galactopyranose mutase [Blattabacteriaceae bacterium]